MHRPSFLGPAQRQVVRQPGRSARWALASLGTTAVRTLLGTALAWSLWLWPPAAAFSQTATGFAPVSPDQAANSNTTPGPGLNAAQTSVYYLHEASQAIEKRFPAQADALRAQARRYQTSIDEGNDPYLAATGQIVMRGYRATASTTLQGYAVYLPKNYDRTRRYPLTIALHGGSANGNLFLGVVLGNNMNWKTYGQHLWDTFVPRWHPDCIIVAPDGFGHVMWRFMGEQDVLDVLSDVQENYAIDRQRITLLGLSNGAVGAYNLGMRHADRFASVLAIAGAPSWHQYAHSSGSNLERRLLDPLSGFELIDNSENTRLRYHHGELDGGPMKPRFVHQLDDRVRQLHLRAQGKWYDAGHDLLYLALRHGALFESLAAHEQPQHPMTAHLTTGDYRARRQRWLEATGIRDYPNLVSLHGQQLGQELLVQASPGTERFLVHANDSWATAPVSVRINGALAYQGAPPLPGQPLSFQRHGQHFYVGLPATQYGKRPGNSGPITDAYFDRMVHVYGTANESNRGALKKQAQIGARGWPVWLWNVHQTVMADHEITANIAQNNHLVLYGTPGDNLVLDRLAARLPIRVDGRHVVVGTKGYAGRDIGAKFIYPNPEAPNRYVLVQTGTNLAAVAGGNRLPDFLPDFVVHAAPTNRTRPRLLFRKRHPPVAQGYFNDQWQLPAQFTAVAPASFAAGKNAPDAAADDRSPQARALDTAPGKLAANRAGAIRSMKGRFKHAPNHRARATHGQWDDLTWAHLNIRPAADCLGALASAGVPASLSTAHLASDVPTPVRLDGPVGGIWYRSTHEERDLIIACELAARLPALSKVLRKHGVRGVDVMSSFRAAPKQSYHAFGLGLDLLRFFTLDGVLSVLHDFKMTPDVPTCTAANHRTPAADALRDIACELAQTRSFSTVLTPNYNRGHRDHLHLDARPDDRQVFVR